MTTELPQIRREDFRLLATDGYPLAASIYHAEQPKAHLLVGAATGAPRGFYRRFAEYAAQQGFSTLTLDYRGIGESKPDNLRGFDMHYLDWATKDLAAALDYLHRPELPLFMVGHSFGGHAFGLLPGHERVSGLYTFGTGAGWHGWMPGVERYRVAFMWKVVAPLIVASKGYLAWARLGMGEDLPKGVYTWWKRWCSFPRYFFEDPSMAGIDEQFAQVRTPIIAANSLDDLWAQPASREAFMAGYRNAPYQARDIDSQAEGLGAIGHMGYFRGNAQPLWDEALNWFQQLQGQAQTA
ncbi:alpha/beta fold hydrolase [Halopseudomonas phragmitis]|uniref:Alpha/beta hydrolase n=2 Tax=Pseudomonadaceae TaxID=135621 RepID=A0A1V0B905_9GAMM|nr:MULTISPECIES: alpha/beta fold hydrolase [Pseudomonadaceae]AQZ96426.1 alpha/beta hydrolase [Halopseudomonas phragmitis]RHW19741.1 alpha/beta hydrolase [Pseudomonas jilinensis]